MQRGRKMKSLDTCWQHSPSSEYISSQLQHRCAQGGQSTQVPPCVFWGLCSTLLPEFQVKISGFAELYYMKLLNPKAPKISKAFYILVREAPKKVLSPLPLSGRATEKKTFYVASIIKFNFSSQLHPFSWGELNNVQSSFLLNQIYYFFLNKCIWFDKTLT